MKEKDTHNEPIGRNKLPDSLRVTPFSTPENFFGVQQQSIVAQLTIEKCKLNADSTTYPVPDHYFDQLEEQILSKVSESKLKNQTATLDYQVPDGYFETLEHSIQSRLAENKLQDAVSDTGFNVPQDYFESLTDTIKKATKQLDNENPENTTIISFSERKKWFSYASTAAVVFLIGIGSYFAVQKDATAPAITEPDLQANSAKVNLHDVSNEEILDYLAQVSEGEDLIHLTKFVENETSSQNKIDKRIDDEDIKEYLNYML
ncbi:MULTISPECIES: hypothetical protein [Sphingobacterium]|uniref:hypothetical protein n=1 Tax=Sphingobacterium TaxID=28453 RepID=UPI0013DC241E|nr:MULTISPECIES: hypothetical protein [unclassified Sphingobacterium]